MYPGEEGERVGRGVLDGDSELVVEFTSGGSTDSCRIPIEKRVRRRRVSLDVYRRWERCEVRGERGRGRR